MASHAASCDVKLLEEESSTFELVLPDEIHQNKPLVTALFKYLGEVFCQTSRQLQLCVEKVSESGGNACSIASTRTSAILFGSCPLEVQQRVSVDQWRTYVQLEWLHPFPEKAALQLQHVQDGLRKRAHFIELFNTAYTKQFIREILVRVKSGDCPIDSPEKFMREYPELPSTLKFIRVKCRESVQQTLQERYASSQLLGSPRRKKAHDKRVKFANEHKVVEFPLTRVEREARMSGGLAVLPDGQPKPFRTVKTGDYIWLNVTDDIYHPMQGSTSIMGFLHHPSQEQSQNSAMCDFSDGQTASVENVCKSVGTCNLLNRHPCKEEELNKAIAPFNYPRRQTCTDEELCKTIAPFNYPQVEKPVTAPQVTRQACANKGLCQTIAPFNYMHAEKHASESQVQRQTCTDKELCKTIAPFNYQQVEKSFVASQVTRQACNDKELCKAIAPFNYPQAERQVEVSQVTLPQSAKKCRKIGHDSGRQAKIVPRNSLDSMKRKIYKPRPTTSKRYRREKNKNSLAPPFKC